MIKFHGSFGCDTNYTVELGEEEIPSANTSNYIDSIFAAEGGTEGDCKNRVGINGVKRRVIFVTRKSR